MGHFLAGVRLFAILGAMLVVGAAPFQAVTGLVGHWKLDEVTSATLADDYIGTHNGTYLGNSTQALGNVPAAMAAYPDPASRNFDGTGDYVSVPDNAALQISGDITIAFWMNKASEAGDWQRLVGKGAGGPRNYGVWEEAGAGSRILFQQYNNGASVLDVFSTGTVPLNAWTHVVARVSGTAAGIFLNGAASGTGTRSGTPSTSSDPLTFGYAGFHTYFPGMLDDVRLYNRALTNAEIGILYNGLPGASGVTTTPAPGEITVSWAASPSPASSYTLLRGYSATTLGVWQTGLSGTSYLDQNLTYGTTYFYAVIANLSVGEGAISNVASGTPDVFLPRYNDHEEGTKDGDCACGSAAGPGSAAFLAAGFLLILLLSARLLKV